MFDLAGLSRKSRAVTRVFTAENVYGLKGNSGKAVCDRERPTEDVVRIGQDPLPPVSSAARELGQGFKVRPCVSLPVSSVTTILDTDGPGIIRHIWITCLKDFLRYVVIRMYWDGEETPSVEAPLGDFFCNAPGYYGEMQSALMNVNPTNAMHCYIPMPYRKHARITVENIGYEDIGNFFYAITATEEPVPEDEYYFHASFRRENPTKPKVDYTIVDGIKGEGRYLGTYMTWQQNTNGWWGEGEVKMYLDGDTDYPTLCGTGTEDYFGGSWCFAKSFAGPYSGNPCHAPDVPGARHSLYRWHLPDPVYFREELRVTIQALGWRSQDRYMPLQDDVSSVAYWYQSEPHAPFPTLPDRDGLEII
jgi:hypothetical protein